MVKTEYGRLINRIRCSGDGTISVQERCNVVLASEWLSDEVEEKCRTKREDESTTPPYRTHTRRLPYVKPNLSFPWLAEMFQFSNRINTLLNVSNFSPFFSLIHDLVASSKLNLRKNDSYNFRINSTFVIK